MKLSHMLLCAAIVVVALAFVFSGGSGAWLLFPVACMAMMGAMMWFMMRPSGRTDKDGR